MIGLMFLSIQAIATEHPELKAFPSAKDGMQRIVIVLPSKGQTESDFKVELIPGKLLSVSAKSQVRIGTSIARHSIKGWGYTYYEVIGSDAEISTLMAIPRGDPQVTIFVQGKPLFVRYNSRLPIVLYVPKGQSVEYRIWVAGENQLAGND